MMETPVALTRRPSPRADGPLEYGWATMPEHTDRIPYGRFRNVYLYITERCQLRCGHCYMGDRLEHGAVMPFEEIVHTLSTWRKLGGSKLTILGGEATLHPKFVESIRAANTIGYEHVIITTNGLARARKKLRQMEPSEFAYVQVSLDGGSAETHDQVRGVGTFADAVETVAELCERGFDTRIICTVNGANRDDCLKLLPLADDLGVKLVKYHVFSVLGLGNDNDEWAITPPEWIDFYEGLDHLGPQFKTIISYQPTYARRDNIQKYADQGYRGCIGRTLDRISIFPDGRCYVCSYLFDTELHFANMADGKVELNRGPNEFELFTKVLLESSCGDCKSPSVCMGGCPAEELAMGSASCAAYEEIVPVCRLWKSEVVAR